MVIKTAVKQRRPGLPSKRPFSSLYELGKMGLKSLGYYDQIKQYDPGYHIERFQKKYSYKPIKRITGHALSTKGFLKKAPFSYNKFGKARSGFRSSSDDGKLCQHTGKSGYCSK